MAPHVSENHEILEHYYSKGVGMLGVSKESHSVDKPVGGASGTAMFAPTIRVIHIFAPKVIKTDVANFRSTVQRLTGRYKKSSGTQRRGRTKALAESTPDPVTTNVSDATSWSHNLEQQSQDHVLLLQRLVGADQLVRSDSMDSANFSGESNTSNETDLLSPNVSFSFHPLNRQDPYSLYEIPAPFFTGDTFHGESTVSRAGIRGNALSLPSAMDGNTSAVSLCDMDISSGLGSTLPPLPDFPTIASHGSSSGLYEMFMPAPFSRLTVHSSGQGNNFFEY